MIELKETPQKTKHPPRRFLIVVLAVAVLLLVFLHQFVLKSPSSAPPELLPADLFAYFESAPLAEMRNLFAAIGVESPAGAGMDLSRPLAVAFLGPEPLNGLLILPVKDSSLFETAYGLDDKTPLETNIGHPVYRSGVPFHGAVYFVYERDWIVLAQSPDPLLRVLEVADGQQPAFSSRNDFTAQRRTYSERLWGRIFVAENQERIQETLDSAEALLEEFRVDSEEQLPVIPALVLLESLGEELDRVDSIEFSLREGPAGYEADAAVRFVDADSTPLFFGTDDPRAMIALLPSMKPGEAVVSLYAYSADPEAASSAWRERIGRRISERMELLPEWERYWEETHSRRENLMGMGAAAVYADSTGARRRITLRQVKDPEAEIRFLERNIDPPFGFFWGNMEESRGEYIEVVDDVVITISGDHQNVLEDTVSLRERSEEQNILRGLDGPVIGWIDPLRLMQRDDLEARTGVGFAIIPSANPNQLLLRLHWPEGHLKGMMNSFRALYEERGEGAIHEPAL